MTYTKKIFNTALTIIITTLFLICITSAASANPVEYSDIKSGDSHFEGVQWLTEKGIKGYPDGSFGVSNNLTRPHSAIMFTNALELTKASTEEVNDYFLDVTPTDLYADFIATVGENGIFKGSNGLFLPKKELTREQMASSLVNAFNLESNRKKEAINLENVSETHKNSVQILADLGITNQLDNFRPKEIVTRGQFATFLFLSYNIEPQPIEVSSIDTKQVNMGSSIDDLSVPSTTEVIYDDGSTKEHNVNWDFSNLDLNTPGDYEIVGTIEHTQLSTAIKIVVNEVIVESLKPITTMEGMNKEELALPSQISLTFQDGTTTLHDVEWDLTPLDLTKPGEYNVSGNIASTNLSTNISIVAEAIDIETFEPITALEGSTVGELPLPDQVTITTQSNITKQLDVNWDLSQVDTTKPGEYIVSGDISSISISATIIIIVQQEFPDSISLSPSNITLKEGETTIVSANLNPSNTLKQNVAWTSSSNEIVSVDQTGTITAVTEGTATITASTENGKVDSLIVTVSNKPSIYTNAYGSVTINGLIKSLSINLQSYDSDTLTIEKIEVYEKGSLFETITKSELETNNISTEVGPYGTWGINLSYKLGIWEDNSYIKFYIRTKYGLYEFIDQL